MGIGTSAPQAKLDVSGTVKVDKIQLGNKVTLAGGSDGYANDEWIRLFTPGTTNYAAGGFAMNKLFVGGDAYLQGRILGNGSNAAYGALTVVGDKAGWSGINFRDGGGTNFGTLMMRPEYSGFFNAADNNWRWYVDNAGNTYQN